MPPFSGGVIVGEMAVTQLVDEIGWVLKVGEGSWIGLFERFEHFVVEHKVAVPFGGFEELQQGQAELGS